MKSIIKKVSALIKNRSSFLLNLIFILISSSIILYSLYLLISASGGIIYIVSAAAFFLVKIVVRFAFVLIINTLPFLFPPAVLYLSVCLFLKKKYLRYYVFLLLFSVYIIWFIKFVLKADLIFVGHIIKLPEILTALIQIYIFTSLIMPDYMCSILSSAFFLLKSFLVFILPDLPFRYDDFGMILALFIFTFLYLNNIVLLIKAAGKIILRVNLLELIQYKSGGIRNGRAKQ